MNVCAKFHQDRNETVDLFEGQTTHDFKFILHIYNNMCNVCKVYTILALQYSM